MDHTTFAGDLQTLKQRVSQLTSKYPQNFHEMTPPSSSAISDPFAVQLDDIFRRLCSVEDLMQRYRRASQDRTKIPQAVDPSKLFASPSIIHKAADIASTTPSLSISQAIDLASLYALPEIVSKLSGELANQQKTSQELEDRLNELDNRMDEFDPNRFTPASSTAGSTEEDLSPYYFKRDVPIVMSAPPPPDPAPVWELYAGDNRNQAPISAAPPPPSSAGYTHPSNYHWIPDFPTNTKSLGQLPTLPPPPSTSAAAPPPPPPPFERDLQAKTDNLYEQNTVMKNQIKELAESNHWLHVNFRNILSALVEQEEDDCENPTASVSSGGVDFRDREITRLDEQLTLAHERLRASEESATKKDSLVLDRSQRIKQLEEMLKEHEAQASEHRTRLERKLVQAEKQASAKTLQVQDLQAQVMERDGAIKKWEDGWRQMSGECHQWHSKLKETERYCHIVENDKRERMSKLAASHEEQMIQLRDFCEQKDAVIQKQQDNISWAGQLLTQRDAELEQIQRRLRSVEDDHKHSLRTCDRQDRMLNECTEEIAVLKRDLDMSQRKTREFAIVSRASSPVAAQHAADQDRLERQPPSSDNALQVITHQMSPRFQPQPVIAKPTDESHDTRRAESHPFVWDDGVKGFVRQEPPLRSPSSPELLSMGERRRRRDDNGGRRQRSNYRRYPELNAPTPSNESQTSNAATYGSASGDRVGSRAGSSTRAGDDTMPSPPLPAPVTARSSRVTFEDSKEHHRQRYDGDGVKSGSTRRMVSENDLRSSRPGSVAQRRNKHLSERRSMMDLPPRRLHAYVEDGLESGGEGYSGEV